MSKLLEQLRHKIRQKHYSIHTEQTYVKWCKQFILFHHKRHPSEMGIAEVEQFLTHLAVQQNVSASTQNVAFNAIIFMYKHILNKPLKNVNALRAKAPIRIPIVLSKNEVRCLLNNIETVQYQLMAKLMYGCGIRCIECLRLRILDIDFDRSTLNIFAGKGNKDRLVPLDESLHNPLKYQITQVEQLHQIDLANGYGEVYLPHALAKKYSTAAKQLKWQYLFPAPKRAIDPRTGVMRHHHLHESTINRAINKAARQAKINKKVTAHTFRHSFATHLVEAGYDIRTIQELLGHKDISTTQIYLHVAQKNVLSVRSPLADL